MRSSKGASLGWREHSIPRPRTARVIAELDNPRRLLKPEMFARVRYAGPSRSVVTVPAGAIVQDEGRTTVFIERSAGGIRTTGRLARPTP